MMLSIGEAAKYLGVSVVTLRRWHRLGKLAPSWRTCGGHRRYDLSELAGKESADGEKTQGRTVAYARVSSYDQKADLERQSERLRRYCIENGWEKAEVIQNLGSGLIATSALQTFLAMTLLSQERPEQAAGPDLPQADQQALASEQGQAVALRIRDNLSLVQGLWH